MKEPIVLLTGIGAPGAPGIIKSLYLGDIKKIIGIDVRANNPGIPMVNRFYKGLLPEDPIFHNRILNICYQENIDVIISIVTKELFHFALNADWYGSHGYHIAISDSKTIIRVNNKATLMTDMKKAGLIVPEFRVIRSFSDFVKEYNELSRDNCEVCFKPTISNGSRGFRIISQNYDAIQNLFYKKPNNTYTSYQQLAEILEKADTFPESLLMEYLPGDEYSIDLLVDHGKALYTIPRCREAMRLGISMISTLEQNKEIIEYCNAIAELFNLHGNIGIQVKKAFDGRFKILEINPRLQGTVVLNTAAGVNLPYYGILLALGEKIPQVNIKWGIQVLRFYDEYYKSEGNYFQL